MSTPLYYLPSSRFAQLLHALHTAKIPDVDAAVEEAAAAADASSAWRCGSNVTNGRRVQWASTEGTTAAGRRQRSSDDDFSAAQRVIQHPNLQSFAEGIAGVTSEHALSLMDRWKRAHPEANQAGCQPLPVVSVRPAQPPSSRCPSHMVADRAAAASSSSAHMTAAAPAPLSVPQFLAVSTLSTAMSGWLSKHLKGRETIVSDDALVLDGGEALSGGGKFASAEQMREALKIAQKLEEEFDRTVETADALGWNAAAMRGRRTSSRVADAIPPEALAALETFKRARKQEMEQREQDELLYH